jgi:hypothetical protein
MFFFSFSHIGFLLNICLTCSKISFCLFQVWECKLLKLLTYFRRKRSWPVLKSVTADSKKLSRTTRFAHLKVGFQEQVLWATKSIALLSTFRAAPTQKKSPKLCFLERLTSQWDDNESAPSANGLGTQRHRYVTNRMWLTGTASVLFWCTVVRFVCKCRAVTKLEINLALHKTQ